MISVRIRNGYNLNVAGKPSLEQEPVITPACVAVLPGKIPFIKPRVMVGIGDSVKVGSVLFVDKRNPDLKFLSPGGGRVDQINFGPRRVISEIVIKLEREEQYERFNRISDTALNDIERDRLVKLVMDGGLWPFIRALPFRDIARPDVIPPAILVNVGNMEPFHPQPEVYLHTNRDLFKYGLNVLKRLVKKKVYVSVSRDRSTIMEELSGLVTHTLSGRYPAHDPGVLLYHTKKTSAENSAWFIDGQDLLLIAQLLSTGRYPTERTVVLAGSAVTEQKHLRTRMGVPLAHLAQDRFKKDKNIRYIAGGLLTGYAGSPETYLGFYESALTLIPEGAQREVLAFVRPGLRKPSYSRTFLSCLNKADLEIDCNLHGSERACIACGHCADVCPVDILPQLTFKSILADEVEESLEHGLLDCVECGLCSYVCPSKIELFDTLKAAKAAYYKEMS